MKVMEALLKIQAELKVGKSQFNKFGGYAYRSTEDILEGIKPLLLREKCVINISDEIQEVGGRVYVKAIVELIQAEDLSKIVTTAYAREDEGKKGFDAPQVTGSSSSYARKYALNGIFAIDDTKDSDHTNTGDKHSETSQNKQEPAPNGKAEHGQGQGTLNEFSVAWGFLTEEQKEYFGRKYPSQYGPQKNPQYFKKTEKEAIIAELKEKGIVK